MLWVRDGTVTSPRSTLSGRSSRVDDRWMPVELTIAFSLIGAAAVVTAVVGAMMTPGDRLSALLALVSGAGVGIASLAIGSRIVDPTTDAEPLFLVASILGFVASMLTLALLWRAVHRGSP
jgi:hypothetical protein